MTSCFSAPYPTTLTSLSLSPSTPPLATGVTVGFEKTEYTVMEGVSNVATTVAVISGTLGDEDEVVLTLVTSAGMKYSVPSLY